MFFENWAILDKERDERKRERERERERRKPSVEVGEGRHIGSTWGCKKAARSRRSKATSYLKLNLFGQLIFASTNKKNKWNEI